MKRSYYTYYNKYKDFQTFDLKNYKNQLKVLKNILINTFKLLKMYINVYKMYIKVETIKLTILLKIIYKIHNYPKC